MSFENKLLEILPAEQVRTNEPMSAHTTFRIGGPADYYLTPSIDRVSETIAMCRAENIPVTIIGNGSNLLVSDKGIRGAVIALEKQMNQVTINGENIYAQAGAMLIAIAAKAAEQSLTGLEFASGIPGTIGGALAMNAGAYGGEMKDIIESVRILNMDGTEEVIDAETYAGEYRSSYIMKNNAVVLDAVLHLSQGDHNAILQTMDELRTKRVEKQPLEYPSAGSTFKRPEGYFAGKLIMDAGLKGYTVGGAQVSEKHAGFVINIGGATASDVKQLMQDVSDKVMQQFGVALEPEVRLIGEF